MDENHEILVVCDADKDLNEHMLQMISKARLLADDSKKEITVLFCGDRKEESFQKVLEYGSDHLIFCHRTREIGIWGYCDVVSDIIKNRAPGLVLFSATDFGKSVAAIISTRFECGLTADCVDIKYERDGRFQFLRAAINDSVIAKITCMNCMIQMCTVKNNVFAIQKYKLVKEGTLIEYYADWDRIVKDPIISILDVTSKEIHKTVDISRFPIVFCIGRGVENPDTVKLIYELASRCNACVVGTRAVVEENVLGKEFQVGQSGNSIAPEIYVGFGVSGASQHLVGIKNAKTIIAVNLDPNAPIFEYADYVIVEDVNNVLMKMEQIISNKDKTGGKK